MKRYAGSKFTVKDQEYGVSTGNYGAAAGATGDIGAAFNAMRSNATEFGELGKANLSTRAAEQAAAWAAEAGVAAAGIGAVSNVYGAKLQSDAAIKSAQIQAEASKDAADAKAGATKSAGIMSAIGSIAGAGIGLLSDERTKHSVEELESVAMMLRNLRPVSFFYKQEYTSDPWRKHYGFIAQEYQEIMPEATKEDTSSGLLTIDTSELIALLVKGYQELDSRITKCEVRQVLEGVIK